MQRESGLSRKADRPDGPTGVGLPGRFFMRAWRGELGQRVLRYSTQSPDFISGKPFTAFGATG